MKNMKKQDRRSRNGMITGKDGQAGCDRPKRLTGAFPLVKICGLRRPEDADYVNAAGADLAGFVFAKGRRRVSLEQAAELRKRLSGDIVSVGVFVNERPEIIAEAVSAGVIGAVQLHGQETAEYIAGLRKLLEWQPAGGRGRVPVIQALRIGGREDLAAALRSEADFLLLDHGAGGTGKSFDWSLIEGERRPKRPFFLAGGLGPGNIEEAVRRIRPFGVDMSSGVETEGFKDREKIASVMYRIRALRSSGRGGF